MAAHSLAPGRHCAICGKPGGTAFTWALRPLGYDTKVNAYAHPNCVIRERKRRAAKGTK